MGEVYRATDTKLRREVALKVLPSAFAHDADRMVRFEREAQVLASLSHPNIAIIHGLEESGSVRALVMELVEGPTLAERLKSGPITIEEALSIAKQVAEALEYAHERGVIHRDLKPANVKITPEGAVKVLDFGLAKALDIGTASGGRAVPESPLQNSPTLSIAATQAGMILGTAAYMSPEQARGRPVDRRADIWAFGCVLYEILSGARAFEGETASDTLAAVIRAEPDWEALPASTPPAIRELLSRCLNKDPRQRLRDIGDARIAIEETLSGEPVTAGLIPPHSGLNVGATSRRALPWAVAGVLGIALAAALAGLWRSGSSVAPPQVLHLAINDTSDLVSQPAISPDGRRVAFATESAGTEGGQLAVRALDQFAATPLRDTQGAANPFFSPDGSWIGYASPQGLMKVPAGGGTSQLICATSPAAEAVWGERNTIVLWGGENKGSLWPGLMRVSALGGAPEVLTSVDASQGEFRDGWPTVLPDGDTVLFTANTQEGTRIDAVSLGTRQRRVVRAGGAFARYDPSGYLLYWAPPLLNLLAAPFDARRLQLTGPPVTVVKDVLATATRSMVFALSSNGTLAYVPDNPGSFEERVVWVDRKGQTAPALDTVAPWVQARLSSDGERLLLRKLETNCELWVYDLRRRVLTRLAYGNDNHNPLWMPDGKGVVFDIPNGSVHGLVWQAADGSGGVQPLIHEPRDFEPTSWSGDGRLLALTLFGQSNWQIWVWDRSAASEPRPFRQNAFDDKWASFSPDGRYLAYASDESGRYEVYVSPFPGPGAVTQVSAGGGTNPLWSRDGRELFYEAETKLMSVKVTTQPSLTFGVPQELFRRNFEPAAYRRSFGREYDVSADGQRFVMLEPTGQAVSPPDIHLIVHFPEELRRLVSAGGI